jgi:2,3-dihydroxybenzoate decarboxylase
VVKKIAIEEHFIPEGYIKYLHSRKEYPKRDYVEIGGRRLERDWWSPTNYRVMNPDKPEKSTDVGEGRLKDMDEAGIDMQVLSSGGRIQEFDASDGISLAQKTNDALAEIIGKYPKRFAGFATLAPQDPEASAGELERAVQKLGLKGAMIFGSIRGEFLDNKKYWVILERAEKLDVPIYVHPGMPPADMLKPYLAYPGLALAMWGFAAEGGLHAMRLILSGVFDKYPNLKIILGHLGESIPYWLWRLDSRWQEEKDSDPISAAAYKNFQKSPSQYFRDNFYVTTSGMYWPPVIQFVCSVLGADRVLFATDYPAESSKEAVQAIEATPISDGDKEKVCHLNAEKLFRL